MNIVVFGDSITQGYYDTAGGWVDRLKALYAQQNVYDLDPADFINLGVSGDSSSDLLHRLETELKARSRYSRPIVIVAIGVNDARQKDGSNYSTAEAYAKHLHQLHTVINKYAEKKLFVGLTPCIDERTNPVAWGETAYQNERIKDFNRVLEDFCREHSVPFVPVFAKMNERQNSSELFPDGLHPNDAGHQILAELVNVELQKLLV